MRLTASTVILIMTLLAASLSAACTIGVASGRATADGRPLVWKVRDNAAVPDNEVYFNDSLTLPFVGVVTAPGLPETSVWMGVNRAGFALVNANANTLVDPEPSRANGEFMRAALGSCRSVREFIDYLEATAGLRDVHANFGVIDSTGAAMLIEADRDSFWTYDADDPAGPGYVVRTNFACNDTTGTGIDGLPGEERFVRSTDLVSGWVGVDSLSVATLAGRHARDFSDWACRPYPLPCFDCGEPDSLHGWFDTFFSISAGGTVSGAVLQGVATGEPAWLTTMWTHLGQPACTLALPYWPVGPAPAVADGEETAPLCDLAREVEDHIVFRYRYFTRLVDSFNLIDGEGGGLWATLLPAEAAMHEVVNERLGWWRQSPPAWSAVLALEDSLAVAAMDVLAPVLVPAPVMPVAARLKAYPNPFNPSVTLAFTLPRDGHAQLDVFDLAGRRVARVLDESRTAGAHQVVWRPERLASGVYMGRLTAVGTVSHQRLVLVR